MKSFFTYLLASFLAIVIAFILFFFILIGTIAGLVSNDGKAPEVKPGTALMLKLDNPIGDRKTNIPFFSFSGSLGIGRQNGLNEILSNIEKAGKDSNISGIYLELSDLQSGIATIDEIRNALLEFRKTGKFIVAFSDTYSQGAYYLATAADKIYLNPAGYINFVGMNAEVVFFRNTLEKLEIEPEIVRHGEFKSAVEPLIYDKMSPENREQIRVYMNSIWSYIIARISESRNIPGERLNDYADSLMTWNNSNAAKLGLVDAALYRDQVMDTINCLSDRCREDDTRLIGFDDYARVPDSREKAFSKNKIAVIYASGDIVMGNQSEGFIGSENISQAIRKARKDSAVKAIVFRVNSGGGSALASEVIWREIELARKVKPVVASMGDVAASGGYYIVAPADTIVASPVTITGSIGVFGISLNMGDFLKNKLGITIDNEKTNKYSDFGSVFRPLSPDERLIMQNYIDETYGTFVSHVADGRKLPYADVDRIGEGRVWSGENADSLHLVDVMGGMNRAVEIAAEMAGIEDYRVTELPELGDPLTMLVQELSGGVKERLLKKELGENYDRLREIQRMLGNDRVQAKIPFSIKVY